MGFFNFSRSVTPPSRSEPPPSAGIPIAPFDISKRYDVHYAEGGQYDRLYENVRFICIRTFDRITEYSSGLIGGYFEIETADGTRFLLPSYGIQLICEHGTQPAFRIVKRRRNV